MAAPRSGLPDRREESRVLDLERSAGGRIIAIQCERPPVCPEQERPAGEGICARQYQRAASLLGQAAGPGDIPANRKRACIDLDGPGPGERDGPVGAQVVSVRRRVQRAAVEGNRVRRRGIADIVRRRDLNGATVDRGRPRVGVRAAENQRARARLRQAQAAGRAVLHGSGEVRGAARYTEGERIGGGGAVLDNRRGKLRAGECAQVQSRAGGDPEHVAGRVDLEISKCRQGGGQADVSAGAGENRIAGGRPGPESLLGPAAVGCRVPVQGGLVNQVARAAGDAGRGALPIESCLGFCGAAEANEGQRRKSY